MIKFEIKHEEMDKWIGAMSHFRGKLEFAITEALNYAGDTIVDLFAEDLAKDINVSPSRARGMVIVTRASSGDMEYRMYTGEYLDEGVSKPERRLVGKQWERRPETFFRADEIVKIISRGDESVCEICQDLEGTLHTIEEARALLPAHPNCRCLVVPAQVKRPPVTFSTKMGPAPRARSSDYSDFNINQIFSRLGDELKGVVKDVMKG